MPTYAELLCSEDWKIRRTEILIRDNRICQKCGNESFFRNFRVGSLGITLSNYTNAETQVEIAITNSDQTVIKGFVHIGAKNFKEVMQLNRFGLYQEIPWRGSIVANVFGIYGEKVSEFQSERIWIYIKGIHVHHKYYQEGLLPWEYPNEALVSFCWSCHEELHANTEVPKLDIHGKVIGKMTPCSRCSGAGMLPEFIHVQEGICFRCEGACYEELLEQNASKL